MYAPTSHTLKTYTDNVLTDCITMGAATKRIIKTFTITNTDSVNPIDVKVVLTDSAGTVKATLMALNTIAAKGGAKWTAGPIILTGTDKIMVLATAAGLEFYAASVEE